MPTFSRRNGFLSQICDSLVLRHHPLLTVLGRRGRGAVVDALCSEPDQTWSVRGLARAAGVQPATAARAVQELEALAALEVIRPGRDAQLRLRRDTEMGRVLLMLRLPDLRKGACRAFSASFGHPQGVRQILRWSMPGDHLADPLCPTRIAVVCRDDPEPALDAIGPALDGVRAEGWPAPDVTVWTREELVPGDPLAVAILEGQPLA